VEEYKESGDGRTKKGELLEEMNCGVCFDRVKGDQYGVIVRTECDHYFHELCLMKWFK
jgi:Ring finger domain